MGGAATGKSQDRNYSPGLCNRGKGVSILLVKRFTLKAIPKLSETTNYFLKALTPSEDKLALWITVSCKYLEVATPVIPGPSCGV